MSRILRAAAMGCLCLLECGCDRASLPAQPGGPRADVPQVYVDSYPLQYFAERISGGQIEVVLPVPENEDPAYWVPDEATVSRYQEAELILLNGADYARWVTLVSLPAAKLVNTSQGFSADFIAVEDDAVHRHGPAGEHSHAGIAGHTWLDPRQALRQAEAVHRGLTKLLPEQGALFEINFEALRSDLQTLDQQLTAANAAYHGQPLFASHPVYQYLARRCGWNLRSLHWEPDQVPADEEWRRLGDLLTQHAARWMIWEAQPLAETAERLQALQVGCVVFAPCPHKPADGDYVTAMRGNIERLAGALGPSDGNETPSLHRER